MRLTGTAPAQAITLALALAVLVLSIPVSSIVAAPALAAAPAEFAPVRDMIPICTACHSESPAAPMPQNPILAGQEYYYLYVQLKDFKSGLRKSAVMEPIVKTVELEKLKLLATYFSEQTWPVIGRVPDRAKAEIARTAIDSGGCVGCHLGDFRGNSRVPRLAGQHPEYLLQTMLDFKSRARNNTPDMSNLLATFSEQELDSLADYLASVSVYQNSTTGEIQ
jgi:cytochrome c553